MFAYRPTRPHRFRWRQRQRIRAEIHGSHPSTRWRQVGHGVGAIGPTSRKKKKDTASDHVPVEAVIVVMAGGNRSTRTRTGAAWRTMFRHT